MANEDRSGRAMDALETYRLEGEEDFDTNCIDLLTDLLHASHLCKLRTRKGAVHQLRAALRMAEMHFDAERKGR